MIHSIFPQNPTRSVFVVLFSSFLSAPLLATELQLGIQQVANWRAEGDTLLIIEDHQQGKYQIELQAPCPGLSEAKSIAFISNSHNALDQSSKVVLPNGKRCAFQSFSAEPASADDTQ